MRNTSEIHFDVIFNNNNLNMNGAYYRAKSGNPFSLHVEDQLSSRHTSLKLI